METKINMIDPINGPFPLGEGDEILDCEKYGLHPDFKISKKDYEDLQETIRKHENGELKYLTEEEMHKSMIKFFKDKYGIDIPKKF